MNGKIENSNVLVTGGAGFIGSNLCETLLNQNNRVVCFDNFSTGKHENIKPFLSSKNFELLNGDIRNYDDCFKSVQGVDHILHQAALGSVPRSIEDPITTNAVNITGFVNMLTAAKNNRIKRFVYAASSSTYGDLETLPKFEDKIGKPLSPYAVTKYVNELYAKVFSDLYGIETIGLRYFNVFGKNQDPNGAYAAAIPKFIKSLIEHKSPILHGDGSQTRDFTYIENVVQANQLALLTSNKNSINTVYNIAFGESTSLNEVIKLLKNELSFFDESIKNIEINFGENRVGDIKHSLASIEKAKDFLNYQPKYSFVNGIKEVINWYWQNLK
jgi:UDP-N-acetylglucosamine/UDP-N-acetylgalactosamine 4-epimerase